MDTKKPIGKVRDDFWTTFGKYMAPVPNALGEQINWVNYKTGVKPVRFVLDLTAAGAWVAVVITDPAVSFLPVKEMFEQQVGKAWVWERGRIYCLLPGRDIRRVEDWPALISFFKEKLLQLDAFWQDVKDGF